MGCGASTSVIPVDEVQSKFADKQLNEMAADCGDLIKTNSAEDEIENSMHMTTDGNFHNSPRVNTQDRSQELTTKSRTATNEEKMRGDSDVQKTASRERIKKTSTYSSLDNEVEPNNSSTKRVSTKTTEVTEKTKSKLSCESKVEESNDRKSGRSSVLSKRTNNPDSSNCIAPKSIHKSSIDNSSDSGSTDTQKMKDGDRDMLSHSCEMKTNDVDDPDDYNKVTTNCITSTSSRPLAALKSPRCSQQSQNSQNESSSNKIYRPTTASSEEGDASKSLEKSSLGNCDQEAHFTNLEMKDKTKEPSCSHKLLSNETVSTKIENSKSDQNSLSSRTGSQTQNSMVIRPTNILETEANQNHESLIRGTGDSELWLNANQNHMSSMEQYREELNTVTIVRQANILDLNINLSATGDILSSKLNMASDVDTGGAAIVSHNQQQPQSVSYDDYDESSKLLLHDPFSNDNDDLLNCLTKDIQADILRSLELSNHSETTSVDKVSNIAPKSPLLSPLKRASDDCTRGTVLSRKSKTSQEKSGSLKAAATASCSGRDSVTSNKSSVVSVQNSDCKLKSSVCGSNSVGSKHSRITKKSDLKTVVGGHSSVASKMSATSDTPPVPVGVATCIPLVQPGPSSPQLHTTQAGGSDHQYLLRTAEVNQSNQESMLYALSTSPMDYQHDSLHCHNDSVLPDFFNNSNNYDDY